MDISIQKNLSHGFAMLVILISLASCTSKQPRQVPPQQVKVVAVQQGSITNHVDFVGQVYGYKDIPIRARVDGYLEGVLFDEGFPVKKGQLLYTIDAQPYKAEVAAMQSKVAETKTMLAKALSDLNRYKPLAAVNAVSQADLDAARSQYEAAGASVKAAEANLKLAKIKLGYTQIKSPINGIIGKTLAKEGEYVGKTPNPVILNTVSRIDEIFVEFFLPENQYLQVAKYWASIDSILKKNSARKQNIQLILADGSTHESKGSINFIDRGVNSNTGAILVQARFKNTKRIVRPGQYAKVRIPYTLDNAVTIPQKCVKELQGQFSVFVVNNQNRVEVRQIEVGEKIGGLWVIDKGLTKNEKVIIDGIQKVQNGVEVIAAKIELKSKNLPQ